MRASTNAELGIDEAGSMVKMLDMLEDLDDVQQVYSNADIPDDVPRPALSDGARALDTRGPAYSASILARGLRVIGVIDVDDGHAAYAASGAVRTDDGDFPDRLRQIFEAVGEIVDRYEPTIVAVENVFMARNAGSALKLGQARSAALCAHTFSHDVDVFEYSPREVKLAVVGTGAATKEQVQHMILSLLELAGTPGADAADALAVALCHAHQRETSGRRSIAAACRLADWHGSDDRAR
jgi:crossover junction endodeoxyribonuclease RuvC